MLSLAAPSCFFGLTDLLAPQWPVTDLDGLQWMLFLQKNVGKTTLGRVNAFSERRPLPRQRIFAYSSPQFGLPEIFW
jgi:hypothetical protein